jgi:hypothetical protein
MSRPAMLARLQRNPLTVAVAGFLIMMVSGAI